MNELEVVKMILEEKLKELNGLIENLDPFVVSDEEFIGKAVGIQKAIDTIDLVEKKFAECQAKEDDDLIDDCFIDSNEVSDLLDELKTTSKFFRTLCKQDPKAFTSTASSHDVNHTDHDEPDDVRA